MKPTPFLSLVAILLVATLTGAAAEGEALSKASTVVRSPRATFLAGASARVITPVLGDPAHPVFVAGNDHGLAATKVHDDLYARALVMQDGGGHGVGLVVLDLIGFFHDDVERIRDELKTKHPEVALDYVAVASTHTHAGPDVLGLWSPEGKPPDDAYIAQVRREAVEALSDAWACRRPARLVSGRGEAPGLSEDSRLPEVIDDTVMALGLRAAEGGEGIASLVQWNSHPTVTGKGDTEISADFPRAVVRRLEKDWGGVALYASGDLGGQIGSGRLKIEDPLSGKRIESGFRRAELLGEQIGGMAMETLRTAQILDDVPEARINVRTAPVFLPIHNERYLEGLARGAIRPRKLHARGDEKKSLMPSEIPRASLKPGAYSVASEVALVDVGGIRWALIPGELYPELAVGGIQSPQERGADFQGAAPEPALRSLTDRPLFLIGLANDEVGYIIPKSQWDAVAPFAYGRSKAQYGEGNSLGPDTAPILIEALKKLF